MREDLGAADGIVFDEALWNYFVREEKNSYARKTNV
jgi:hypothetical protein